MSTSKTQPQAKKGSGGSKGNGKAWESLGVNAAIARALALRGFKNPTPIQRATLPVSLAQPAKDVLGMARTGSGKTFAYLVPILQRVLASSGSGPKALILCPNRELAYQILKAGKDLGRSLPRGIEGRKNAKWVLAIGGDGMEEQFAALSSEPDIIIATPGRFLHLAVEMKLDLRSIEVVVYDEADRLFEMGFNLQLHEIIHRLPSTRQSLLFSATLPAAVAEFAKAGLSNPSLVRLDADQKISPDLKMVFLHVSPMDKIGALIAVLENLIGIPLEGGITEKSSQAIIFVATKHHAEYLNTLLETCGYACSMVYGSLDQVARHRQLERFRRRLSSLLVVTDVAARGLDIPVLEHVINFDLPASPRVFVHRVGRTARAGRKGTAWSLVSTSDLSHYFDLETVLGDSTESMESRIRTLPRFMLDDKTEYLAAVTGEQSNLSQLAQVMDRSQAMYERSRNKSTVHGMRRAKEYRSSAPMGQDPMFQLDSSTSTATMASRASLIAQIGAFQPKETVLDQRIKGVVKQKDTPKPSANLTARPKASAKPAETSRRAASSDDKQRRSFKDESFCLPDAFNGDAADPYSMTTEPNFSLEAKKATVDLLADEGKAGLPQKASQLKWDRKKKRFTRGKDGQSSKDLIRSESGAMIPITYDSGRFLRWQKGDTRGAQRGHSDRDVGSQTSIKTAEQLRRERTSQEMKRQKNARATHSTKSKKPSFRR